MERNISITMKNDDTEALIEYLAERHGADKDDRDDGKWLLKLATTNDLDDYLNHVVMAKMGGEYKRKRLYLRFRQMFKEMLKAHEIEANPMDSLPEPPAGTACRSKALSPDELAGLMDALDADRYAGPSGLRMRALILLILATALRPAALQRLNVSDFDPDTGVLTTDSESDRPRRYQLDSLTRAALEDWLAVREPAESRALFVNSCGDRIASQSIPKMLERAGKRIGIALPYLRLRRTAATELYRRTGDFALVDAFLGSGNADTTERTIDYDLLSEAESRKGLHFMETLEPME